MGNRFQSALDKVHAEEQLVQKTAQFLKAHADTADCPAEGRETIVAFNKRRTPSIRRLAFVAAMAVLLLAGSIGGYVYYKHPVAYLSVDINPSVELGINAFDQVVSVTAYNQDGQAILEGQDILYSPVEQAISNLVVAAAQNGYVEEDGSTIVSVTSETDDPEKGERLENAAEQGVNQAAQRTGTPAVVYKDNVALARRAQAREIGITPGKLNLIQKLQALDDTVTVEELKDAKVKDIMKEIVEKRKEVKAEQKAEADGDHPNQERLEKAMERVEKAIAKAEERKLESQEKTRPTNDSTALTRKVTGADTTATGVESRTKATATTDPTATSRTSKEILPPTSRATKGTAEPTVTKPDYTRKTDTDSITRPSKETISPTTRPTKVTEATVTPTTRPSKDTEATITPTNPSKANNTDYANKTTIPKNALQKNANNAKGANTSE